MMRTCIHHVCNDHQCISNDRFGCSKGLTAVSTAQRFRFPGISGSLLRLIFIGFACCFWTQRLKSCCPCQQLQGRRIRWTTNYSQLTVAVMASVCVILLSIMVSAGTCCSSHLDDSTKGQKAS